MRNYIKRNATSAGDTINIMNPGPLHQRSTTGRIPGPWRGGIELSDEEQPNDSGSVEGVMVSPIWRNGDRSPLRNSSFQPLEIKIDRIVQYD
jgi:hypothetical protein